MRHLLLLRHAKSSWADASLADFDRPLAARGLATAPRIGREMAERGWLLDRALVSSAMRTRQTWALVSAEWPRQPEHLFSPALYGASAEQLFAEIALTPDRIGSLLLIGHNPGLEDFARQLAGDASDARALARLRQKFPTAALARFKLDGTWADLGSGTAVLSHFVAPKDLD